MHDVSRLLDKLDVNNRLQAATFAIRHGLVDERRGSG
jgi:DNA-binding NarL/FixJ family response regulator